MDLSRPKSTWICLAIIIVVLIVCIKVVFNFKENDTLARNRRIVEYFPTLISTLGVLGTFFGITMGLMYFNAKDLPNSIPNLLDGLKTAFFTSLVGMIGSMVLSVLISYNQDENDGGVSDIDQAAGEICQAVEQMGKQNKETVERLVSQMENQEKDRKAFYSKMGSIMESVNKSQKVIESILEETSGSMISSIGKLEENSFAQITCMTSLQKPITEIAEFTHHIPEMLDVAEGISGTQEEINAQVQKLKDILDAEVLQIDESIAKTNKLLERKFDEFTELLKKSNTEALVDVMKRVTEEFQKQMNALINKLIQENFDQLNKSVEKLNQWQQENKEMIAALTKQYKEMSENFEATSTSLAKVKEDTMSLVGEGGKLQKLIDSLSQVIVQDERFIKVTEELHQAAELNKNNMASYEESTKSLNEWVRKQRKFVDGVQVLIAKLEELDKIRDYGEQFWRGTKEKMEEGVGIISKGSQTLNSQLTSLDKQFYGRLSATLAELDNCITKMVEQVNKRR